MTSNPNFFVELSSLYPAGSATSSPPSSSENKPAPAVAIVLGFYDGNAYLHQQISSILNQSHRNLQIFIADDGSPAKIDPDRLNLSAADISKIHIGERTANVGFTRNFLEALAAIDDPFDYYAFSDQDDIWHDDKIARALSVLQQYPDKAALYCARTAISDEAGVANLGTSPLFSKPPSFANALVQSIGGGNTMVFNKAARDLIVAASAGHQVVSHDWWCYQIVSGAGGIVYYDPEPCLKYRQHGGNLVGSNNGMAARFIRLFGLINGAFREWNDTNMAALSDNRALLTAENQKKLDDFIEARQNNLIKRLGLCRRNGIYRQTFLGNLGLWLGLLIKKV